MPHERNNAAYYWLLLLLLMLAGSLLSRAVLSLSTVLFLLYAIRLLHWQHVFNKLPKEPAAWSQLLLFLVPCISGLTGTNLAGLSEVLLMKLPYLLMPLAFVAAPSITGKQWRSFVLMVLLMLLLACGWSIAQYLYQADVINSAYLRAKTLPVLMDNDHLRFSWLLAIGLMAAMWFYDDEKVFAWRCFWLTAALLIFVFLHLLAARSGLFLSYLFWFCYFLVHQRFKLFSRSSFFPALILLLVILAWLFFPTLQNRWKYVLYTYHEGLLNYLPGSSDGGRILSIKAGWDMLLHHPFGMGSGDIRTAMYDWYDIHYPGMLETDKQVPANEWLIHGLAAGWPGIVLFSIALFAPFFSPVFRKDFYATMLLLFTLFIAFTDSSLEGQLGIFIHTFTLLLWWQWLSAKKNKFVA